MDCPTCGKELSSERGMRQHHTKVHDEPLPNRTCKGCETEFYDPKARREFCDDCNPNGGTHNGNWKGAKQTTTCEQCNAEFEYYPSDKPGIFCAECVESADGLLPENYAETVPRVAVECGACGAAREVRPAAIEQHEHGFFCGLECYGRWLSSNVVGPDHHQWEGGTIEYGQTWWRIRRRALERDGYECQHCGVTKSELGRNPDVHHLQPVRSFDDPEDAHTLDNVVTLCRSCHRHAEAGTLEVSPDGEK